MPEYDYTVTVTARNRAEAEKLMTGLRMHPFKCGPPFKSAAVRAAHRAAQGKVTTLCIRDSDYANHYVTDGEVDTITIDVGGDWSSYRDFAACLARGEADAVEYERGSLAEVAHLGKSNPVRVAVESFFAEARANA